MAGGGRETDEGVDKERITREGGTLATSAYYTISTIFVKGNISIVVSVRWQTDGSAALMPARNPGSRDVQTSTSRDPPGAAHDRFQS